MLALRKYQNSKVWEARLKVCILRYLWLGGFSVAFDPIDGSSIVDTNFTVGTIFGVWLGEKLTGVTRRDQVAPAMVIYGLRATYVLALKDIPGTHEFLLLDEGTHTTLLDLTATKWATLFSVSMQGRTLSYSGKDSIMFRSEY
ncbi:unnamed protein product [Ilex paraguariensis]|uniref:Fructose-1-6-bisphosphatase class I N-terminal domain-containing protein n=1 Tax=Ilex paraguariensis TaxID=185542 RepID=A0ABC8U3H6_9AQUA